MRIYHSNPVDDCTALPNELLQDDRLSGTALGVLVRLLSMPDVRDVNADLLWKQGQERRGSRTGEGRRAIRAAFAELETAGYMRRRRGRRNGGEFFTILEVTDAANRWADHQRDEARVPLPERGQAAVVYVIGEPPSAMLPREDAMTRPVEPALRTHVRKILHAIDAYKAVEESRIRKAEEDGYRIVDGGGYGDGNWETHDYGTGETLAEGTGGYDEYSAVTEKLNREKLLVHIDHITEDLPDYDIPATDGIPPSLAEALVDWVETAPDDEVAQVAAWE